MPLKRCNCCGDMHREIEKEFCGPECREKMRKEGKVPYRKGRRLKGAWKPS